MDRGGARHETRYRRYMKHPAASEVLTLSPLAAASGERLRTGLLPWRRGRLLEAVAREVALDVGREVLRRPEHRLPLLEAIHIEQHRQDVDVGERELVADQVARL